jgi:iron complex outermembrane receptor protein
MKSPLSRSFLLAALTLGIPSFAADAKPAPKVLPSIIITGAPEGYAAQVSAGTLRTPTPLREVAQSVQVITNKLIRDQLAMDPSVVVRNFSGVVGMDVREMNNANYLIRGFSSEAYLDGFQLYLNQSDIESLANIERIEVVKGPTGTLFGGANGAPLGGLLNFISKSPEKTAFRSLSVNAGSFGAHGAMWDFNQPLDASGKVLFRLTGDARETRDQNPAINGSLVAVNPTLALELSDDTLLTVRARFSRRSQTDYSGLPAVGTVNAGSPTYSRDFIFLTAGQPPTTAENRSVGAELKHAINRDWKLTSTANYLDSALVQNSTWPTFFPAFFPTVGSNVPVDTGYMPISIRTLSMTNVLNGRVDAGLIRHDLALGLDLDRTDYSGTMWVAPGAGVINVNNPGVLPGFDNGGGPGSTNVMAMPMAAADNIYKTVALFAQDQLTIDKVYHLSGSVRWTHLSMDDVDTAQALDSHRSHDKVTWRFGAGYDINDSLTAFTGWGQGFQAPVSTPISAGPVPVTAEQWEAGFKMQLAAQVQASLVYFNNERSNVPVPSPTMANPFDNAQTGHQRAKGFELDLVWQLSDEFSLLANYAHQDVVDFTTGKSAARVPQDSGRLAARYDFKQGDLAGLGVGLGWTVVSRQQGNPANSFSTPGYGLVDAQVSYVKGPMSYSVGVENLLGATYYRPFAFLGGGVAPGAPRTFFAQAALKF